MNTSDNAELLAATPHLEFVQRGTWSYVRRANQHRVVCIAALNNDQQLILVEQYRPPVDGFVIELPAGLAGDIEGNRDEPLYAAAARELVEETGYVAEEWEELASMTSSAGLTDESVTMFRASHLHRQTLGGGDDSEDIRVHEVPFQDVPRWLRERVSEGKLVDGRVYAALHFLAS